MRIITAEELTEEDDLVVGDTAEVLCILDANGKLRHQRPKELAVLFFEDDKETERLLAGIEYRKRVREPWSGNLLTCALPWIQPKVKTDKHAQRERERGGGELEGESNG